MSAVLEFPTWIPPGIYSSLEYILAMSLAMLTRSMRPYTLISTGTKMPGGMLTPVCGQMDGEYNRLEC
jgi:hypothetical protein